MIDESEKRVDKLDARVKKLEAELDEVRDKLQDENEVRMTKEEFFKFLETAHLQMRNGDFEQKDLIAKTLFSKLYIDHKNGLTVFWKLEFSGLISSPNMHNVNNGEPGGTSGFASQNLLSLRRFGKRKFFSFSLISLRDEPYGFSPSPGNYEIK